MNKHIHLESGYPGARTSVYATTNLEHLAPGNALITIYMAGVTMTLKMNAHELGQLADMLNTAREELAVTA